MIHHRKHRKHSCRFLICEETGRPLFVSWCVTYNYHNTKINIAFQNVTHNKSTPSSQAVLCIWAGSIYSCELMQLDEVQCNLKATLLVVNADTICLVRTKKIRLKVLTAQEFYVHFCRKHNSLSHSPRCAKTEKIVISVASICYRFLSCSYNLII